MEFWLVYLHFQVARIIIIQTLRIYNRIQKTPEKFSVVESQEPTLTEVDWSNYFEGLTGTAIVYDPTEKKLYDI